MEEQPWKTSLKTCHIQLRNHIASVLPALRSLLTDEEYSRVEDREGNFGCVDELVAILLDKDETTFDEFCSVLEAKGYLQLSKQLMRKGAEHSASDPAEGPFSSSKKELAKDRIVATPSDGHVLHSPHQPAITVAVQPSIPQDGTPEPHSSPTMIDRHAILSPKDGSSLRASFFSFVKKFIKLCKGDCRIFGILVVGETGVGKSSLINNLLGKEVAEVGNTFSSQTSIIVKTKVQVEGVHVELYDTPGLGDSRGVKDDLYLHEMKRILKSGEIHLVIYCMKLSETRLRASIIHTFEEYHKIGVKWEHTVIALTFADVVPVPKQVKRKPGFKLGHYFDDRVAEMSSIIKNALVERVGVKPNIAKDIKFLPSTEEPQDKLLNGKDWYVPLWLDILDLLSPGAAMQFLTIHANHLESSYPEEAVSDSRDTSPVANDAKESAVPSETKLPSPIPQSGSKLKGASSNGASEHDNPGIPLSSTQETQIESDSTTGTEEAVSDSRDTSPVAKDAKESAVPPETDLPSPILRSRSKLTVAPTNGASKHDFSHIPLQSKPATHMENDSTTGTEEAVSDSRASSPVASNTPESTVPAETKLPSPIPRNRSKLIGASYNGASVHDTPGIPLTSTQEAQIEGDSTTGTDEVMSDIPASSLVANNAIESAVPSETDLPATIPQNRSKVAGELSSGVSKHDSPTVPLQSTQQTHTESDSTTATEEAVSDSCDTSPVANDAKESAVPSETKLPSPIPRSRSKLTSRGVKLRDSRGIAQTLSDFVSVSPTPNSLDHSKFTSAPSSRASLHDSAGIAQKLSESVSPTLSSLDRSKFTGAPSRGAKLHDSRGIAQTLSDSVGVSPTPNSLDRSKFTSAPSSRASFHDSTGIAQKLSDSASSSASSLDRRKFTEVFSNGIPVQSPAGIPTVPVPHIDFEDSDDSPNSSSDESQMDSDTVPASKPKIRLNPEQQTRLRDIFLTKVKSNARAVEDAIKGSFGGVIGFVKSVFSRKKRK